MARRPAQPHEYEEVLSDYDQSLVGQDVRLTVPLRSRARLKTVAGFLRGLAARLEATADDPGLNDRHALMDAGHDARATQKKILEACGLVKVKTKRPVPRKWVKEESS